MAEQYVFVIDPKHYEGYAKTVLIDGVCPHTNKTQAELEAEGFTIMSSDEYTKFYDAYWKSICGNWREITEEQYYDQLNVMPPRKYTGGGFFMGEAYSGAIAGFYQKMGDRYFTSLQDLRSPRAEILCGLDKWIAEHPVQEAEKEAEQADDKELKTYLVPVVWQVMGRVEVQASSPEEAKRIVAENWDDCPLPDNGDYIEDSFEVDMEGIVMDEYGNPCWEEE